MKVNLKIRTTVFIASFITMCSCNKDDKKAITSVTDRLTPYTINYPVRFPKPEIPADNMPYKERIELGRMLYYDPILSNDGRACASCHLQSYGFTIPGTVGVTPVLPHVNLAWHTNFMWDGSKKGTLEDVMLFETKEFFATDLDKINGSNKYRTLFKKCYGVDNITHKDIAYALAQFTRTMISGNSKYDRFVNGLENLSTEEFRGWQIFFSEKGDCFHCHTKLLTTDNQFHNTGLDSHYQNTQDMGYYNVTMDNRDIGKFRTPNLRNVALRTSFMHDGRFTTLEEVIDFYDHGVYRTETLDPIMTKPGKETGLKLTDEDKKDLVAFLRSFTDSTFLTTSELKKTD